MFSETLNRKLFKNSNSKIHILNSKPSNDELKSLQHRIEEEDIKGLFTKKFLENTQALLPNFYVKILSKMNYLSIYIPAVSEEYYKDFYQSLEDNKSLERLEITSNFTESEFKSIQKFVNFNTNLKTLKLYFLNTKFYNQCSFEPLYDGLKGNKNLTCLDLRFGQVEEYEFLQNFPNLKKLQMPLENGSEVQQIFDNCANVEKLVLVCNESESIRTFDASKSKIKSFHLDCEENFEGMEKIIKGVNSIPLITYLKIYNMDGFTNQDHSVSDKWGDELVRLLKKNQLKSIVLSNIFGYQRSLNYFIKGLEENSSLEELDFSLGIGFEDIKRLGSSLISKKRLKRIRINDFYGLNSLLNPLKHIETIEDFHIYLKFDSKENFESLLEFLKNNRLLKTLMIDNLSYNTEEEVKRVFDLILSLENLKYFSYYSSQWLKGETIINFIKRSRIESINLKTLDFKKNEFQRFSEALIQNKYLKSIKILTIFNDNQKMKFPTLQEMMKKVLIYNNNLIYYELRGTFEIIERNLSLMKTKYQIQLKLDSLHDIYFHSD